MRKNNISNWKTDSSLDCLLFFAQRMDELLFHHSIDSYRYPALSTHSLALEYCRVYEDVKNKTIGASNLVQIQEELVHALKSDSIAKSVLNEKLVDLFLKDNGSMSRYELYQHIRYITRKLGSLQYYKKIVKELHEQIETKNEKRVIDYYSKALVRELIDNGYDENYIYEQLQRAFFKEKVEAVSSFDSFINVFDFEEKRFDIFLGYSVDVSFLVENFKIIQDLKVEIVPVDSAPKGIRRKKIQTIIKFSAVTGLDKYSCFRVISAISGLFINCYCFYKHVGYSVEPYGQVMLESGEVFTIKTRDLLKQRVSSMSNQESTQNTQMLFQTPPFFGDNIRDILQITRNHNAAIQSNNSNDSLLGLWSILEKLSDDGEEKENDPGAAFRVIDLVVPFLKQSYLVTLTQTTADDIIRWNNDFFQNEIMTIPFGDNQAEKTFAFLAFSEYQTLRDKLYALTDDYPLLRYRIFNQSESFKDTKNIKSLIANHVQRVTWHLHRIYRSRNYIVHDGGQLGAPYNDMLIYNLHSYVDIVVNGVLNTISKAEYPSTIREAIVDNKISSKLMGTNLENAENEKITSLNAKKILYYDIDQ